MEHLFRPDVTKETVFDSMSDIMSERNIGRAGVDLASYLVEEKFPFSAFEGKISVNDYEDFCEERVDEIDEVCCLGLELGVFNPCELPPFYPIVVKVLTQSPSGIYHEVHHRQRPHKVSSVRRNDTSRKV